MVLKVFFVALLFVLISVNLFADPCDKTPTATINVTLDFSESQVPLRGGGWKSRNKLAGVQSDRKVMRALNKTLFSSDETLEFTDSDAIAQESITGKSQKEIFIDTVKKFAKSFREKNKGYGKVFLNISTHGVRCKNRNGEVKWGFVIPQKQLDIRSAAPAPDDENYLYNCDSENFKNLFVSAEDLVDSIDPSGIIVDTCYSGHLEKNLIEVKHKILNKEGLFIFTSSLDFLTALEEETDSEKRVGPLFHALGQLVESSDICDLDINSDGDFSQEEIAMYMLGFYFKNAHDKMPIDSLLKEIDAIPEIQQSWKNTTANLGSVKVSSSCMMKINSKFNCPRVSKPENSNPSADLCSYKQTELESVTKKLKAVFSLNDRRNLFSYTDLKEKGLLAESRPSSSGSNTLNSENLEKRKAYAKDFRRLQGTQFFTSYLERIKKEYANSCEFISSPACQNRMNELESLNDLINKSLLFYRLKR